VKIAYVEDDIDARNIFSRKLAERGFECRLFDNSEALLEEIGPGSFDVLVVDILLGGISGIELLAKIRGRGIETPCILITAFNRLEYARDALNANANYLLEKPFDFNALLEAIRKVCAAGVSVQHCVNRGLAELALTPRETDIARLVLKGLSNLEIARNLHLSEKTVKQYLSQIYDKAQVGGRSEFFSSIFPV
jgi:DNA-binding NarL/FixJ family response regulator